jgi:ATP-dependent helicase YprA (DUF1998 family)
LLNVILLLTLITGDSYRVEKSGDETSGFVTKVVMTDKTTAQSEPKDDDSKSKMKTKKQKPEPKTDENTYETLNDTDIAKENKKNPATDKSSNPTDKPLNKRQRQQLKRKARLEADNTEKQKKIKLKSQHQSSENISNSIPLHKSESKDTPPLNQAELFSLQSAWVTPLHSTILASLHSLNYTYPTPIQAATLSAAILGRRDIVGAAPTGSGKTLSYGLPILQWLFDNVAGEDNKSDEENEKKLIEKLPLQALVLVPTREVSVQCISVDYIAC